MARVLVIDDQDFVRLTIRRALEDGGHDVVEAADGDAALDTVADSDFDIVITDIVMPRKDGLETIRELKREKPDLKIIAISGGGQTNNLEYLEFAKRMGADHTLAKPLEARKILQLVNETGDGCP